jgi:hypothetical protein
MLFEIASAMGAWLFFFFLLFFDPLSSSWRYVSQPLTYSSSFFYLGIFLQPLRFFLLARASIPR